MLNSPYNPTILNPIWVVGFIDGEACFHVSVIKNVTMALGYSVSLEFSITQHIRDLLLMEKFVQFFGCGYVIKDAPTKVQFRIRDRADLANHLFPFLDNHPLQTIKSLDYSDFKRVHALLESKAHLTQQGLNDIRTIVSGINRGRINNTVMI
jgi:hypothetical protein